MTGGSPSRLLPTLGVALLFTIIGAFLLRGSFVNFEYLGSKDWNAFMGQAQAEVSSLERYGEFPLWNPWRRGGQIAFAQPESMFLTPVTPLALGIGVIAAFKLLLVPIFVMGCLGMWLLAGQLGLVGVARLAPALMFFSSAAYPYYLAGGLPNWLFGIAILPWLLWARRRGTSDHRFVVLGAAGYAGVIFAGSVYQFVFFPIIVGLDGLLESIQTRRWRPMLVAIAMLLVGSAISLVRVLPMFDVYRVYPRELAAEERYLTLGLIARAFLDPTIPDLSSLGGTVFRDGTNWVSWVTVGCYVGPLFATLAILGFVMRWNRSWTWAAVAIFLGWMSLGAGAEYSLWNLLHGLPLLKSMQAPERLLVPAGFMLSIGAGFGIEACERLFARNAGLLRKRSRLLQGLVLAMATAVPLVVNDEVPRYAFLEAPTPDLPAPGKFMQIIQPKRETQWGGELMEAVLTNRGNPFAQVDVPSPHAVQSADAPGYQGEVWLTKGRGQLDFEVRARTIRVSAELEDDDTLIVNQNYFPGWVASGTVNGPMVARQGLLSLALPAGKHELVLSFQQHSVIIGSVLSVLALLIALSALLVRRARGGTWSEFGSPEVVTLVASALMLLALPISAITGPSATSTTPVTTQRSALIVEANSQEESRYADIQLAIEDAAPGETILVKPGVYGPFRMRAGLNVIAEQPGTVHIGSGSVEIIDVPLGFPAQIVGVTFDDPKSSLTIRSCSANVILQRLTISGSETPEAVAVHIEQSGPVHLLRSRTGAVHVRGGVLMASHGVIRAADRGEPIAGLDVLNGRALLNEMDVHGSKAPAVLANRGRIDASHQKSTAFSRDDEGPLLKLTRDSWLRLSVVDVPDSRIEREKNVRVDRFDPALPTVRFTKPLSTSSEIEVEIIGPKNANGTLIVSPVVSLIEIPGSRQFVQSNVGPGNFLIPLRLPESGVLRFNTKIQGTQLTVGWPIFLQFVAQVEGPKKGLIWKGVRCSLLDGACVEP